jgi:hypothetical protein
MSKKRLKPTLILALDPFAAAFCEGVRSRLERDFGARGSLIQTYVLVRKGEQFYFESDLTLVKDETFDLGETAKRLSKGSDSLGKMPTSFNCH